MNFSITGLRRAQIDDILWDFEMASVIYLFIGKYFVLFC